MASKMPVELHTELLPFVRDGIMKMVHHPLVIGFCGNNGILNETFLQKKKMTHEAFSKGEWHHYVFLHERPYRLDALMKAVENGLLDFPTLYWKIVGRVWTDSENIYQNLEDWKFIWEMAIPHREHAMNEDEQNFLNEKLCDDPVTIYRGTAHEESMDGMSWTLDKNKAEWFANRFAQDDDHPVVIEGVIKKKYILAYFNGRSENEIVVLGDDVKIIDIISS